MRWHNEYNVGTLQRPGLQPFTSPEDAVEKTAGGEGAASTIGTPDDLVKTIKSLMRGLRRRRHHRRLRARLGQSGKHPPQLGHGGALRGARRSTAISTSLRKSQKFVIENRAVFERAGQAVMAKIMENDKAAAALPLTGPGRVAIPTINAPDLQKEAAKRKA